MKNKIGDLFSVKIHDSVKYFQYLGDDETQLGSNVIRVFRGGFLDSQIISIEELENSGVDFYAHVILKLGIKLGVWNRLGFGIAPSFDDITFRDSDDYGNPEIQISNNWWVWTANKPMKKIGRLHGDLLNSQIGIVISPDQIAKRMELGSFQFFYPVPD